MKTQYTDDIDTGSMKKTVKPAQGVNGSVDFDEHTGRSTMCEGMPVDAGSKKHFTKPRDLDQTETRAKKFV